MKEDGIRPNEKFYVALIRATGNGERSDVTLLLLKEMEKLGIEPGVRTWNTAVGACGKVCRHGWVNGCVMKRMVGSPH